MVTNQVRVERVLFEHNMKMSFFFTMQRVVLTLEQYNG